MKMPQENESKKLALNVNNMVCESCEKIIEKSVQKLPGTHRIEVSYSDGKAQLTYNPKSTSPEQIIAAIKEAGYDAQVAEEEKKKGKINFNYILLGLLALIILVFGYIAVNSVLGGLNISIPQLDAKTSIILIFFVGLLTGFHCIGMCGAFVLSYTAKARKENPTGLHLSLHAKYAAGKIISYSIIGGIFGLIGSLFVFTPQLRAIVAILAGAFLILFGLKMLNIFPILRKFSLPTGLFDKLKIGPLKSNNSDPLIIGLMNGLFIACGPLQAMYILAATTGSILVGAIMLFAFAIGTLIPMLGFGLFASFISHAMQNKIVRVSGVIVLIMGLLMINNGLALTGNAINLTSTASPLGAGENTTSTGTTTISTQVDAPYQIIHMDVTNAGWSPSSFVLKKGVPVKWVINGKELTGCNSSIIVPAYNLSFNIKPGEQTIEFTPTNTGVIQWSCGMGMIHGTFVVRDDVGVDSAGNIVLAAQTQQQVTAQVAASPKPSGGCGCMGGGATSCQMAKKV